VKIMKNFKLIIVAMLVIAMSLVLFAACGDKEEPTPTATPVGTEEPAGTEEPQETETVDEAAEALAIANTAFETYKTNVTTADPEATVADGTVFVVEHNAKFYTFTVTNGALVAGDVAETEPTTFEGLEEVTDATLLAGITDVKVYAAPAQE
jgi:ABC-type oligopeptide transport system substrate-binding subunit